MLSIKRPSPNILLLIWRAFYCEIPASDYQLTRWLFLRCLGGIYLIAFASFSVQALGLIGSNGILPVQNIFPIVIERFTGIDQFLRFPTLFWLDASDQTIVLLTIAGMVSAILLMLRVFPVLTMFFCWAFYLSIITAGQNFMSFQWDNLLVEAGFLAIFLAPWQIRPSIISNESPPRLMIWLFRWLVFRLMFASGMVKLLSGDETWHGLTAMTFHYETQPIPNLIAWFMHQLPFEFHQFETAFTLFFEIVIPIFFFAPRRLRHIAGGLTILLQVLIFVTGNYTYFNLLTIVLCISLFDDRLLKRIMPSFVKSQLTDFVSLSRLHHMVLIIGVMIVGSLSIVHFGRQIFQVEFPAQVVETVDRFRPLRLVNTYGLFARMTTERPQIIIEGSRDGEEWKVYGLRYQPQALSDMPIFVAPHQPRLEWQLWFAALGNYENNRWFVSFMRRLLEGSSDVNALIGDNPFPDDPPRFVRARRYDYHFSDWETLNATGEWWQREFRDDYIPTIGLENFNN